jgi:hypothetical protein
MSLPKFEDLPQDEQSRLLKWEDAAEAEYHRIHKQRLDAAGTPVYIEGSDKGSVGGHASYWNDDSDIGPAMSRVEQGVDSPDMPGTPPNADLPYHKMPAGM